MSTIDPPVISAPVVTEQTADEQLRDKIIHVLKVYPVVSPSMMQSAIGSNLPTKLWKPVLERMIKSGEVMEDHLYMNSPSGRNQTYTQLRLRGTTYFITYGS